MLCHPNLFCFQHPHPLAHQETRAEQEVKSILPQFSQSQAVPSLSCPLYYPKGCCPCSESFLPYWHMPVLCPTCTVPIYHHVWHCNIPLSCGQICPQPAPQAPKSAGLVCSLHLGPSHQLASLHQLLWFLHSESSPYVEFLYFAHSHTTAIALDLNSLNVLNSTIYAFFNDSWIKNESANITTKFLCEEIPKKMLIQCHRDNLRLAFSGHPIGPIHLSEGWSTS